MEFSGLRTTSWVTDTGEVLREESPLGLITVREPATTARAMAVPGRIQSDLLEAAAVVPITKERIDEPRDVRRLRFKLDGADLSGLDLEGAGQAVIDAPNHVIEIRDPQTLVPTEADPTAEQFLAAEPFIESDDPAIRAEAERAVSGIAGTRARVERLTRYVNGLLEKSTPPSLWPWRARSAFRPVSPSAWSSCAAPSTTMPGPRSISAKAAGAGCGCRSIRP